MRDSFVFYRSFWEAMKELPDKDIADTIRAIAGYALDEIEPKEPGVAKSIYIMAKPQIDANNKRYENGKRGGKPIDNQNETNQEPNRNQEGTKPEPRGNQTGTKPEPNDNVNVNENVNVNDNIKTSCPEAETAPDKIAASFILNDGSMYNVTENDVVKYQQLYPGIDCRQELRNIVGWCDANPKNRKTRAGAKRFINGWLSKSQNRARPEQRKPPDKGEYPHRQYDFEEIKRQIFDG